MNNLEKTKNNVRIENPHVYLLLKSKGNLKKFQVNKTIYDLLKDSEWVDNNFYYENYPSVNKSKMDPLLHYILFGYNEGKFPSEKFKKIYSFLNDFKLFDENYYFKNNPNIKKSRMDPLLLYILFGYNEGRFPSEKFKKIYDSLKDSGLFDENCYLKNSPNIKKPGPNPLLHYILFGYKGCKFSSRYLKKIYDSLKDSELFDEFYYSLKYPGVKRSGVDPLLHYILFGYRDGMRPSFKFDVNYYLNTNEEVRESGINPLVHYVNYGKDEGKIIKSNSESHKFAKYSDRDLKDIFSVLNTEKIVIILYINNEYDVVEKSIKSILEYTKINYELIVIDDGCTDDRIKTLLNKLDTFENLTVIKNHEKLGYFKSINLIIKSSKSDILLIKSNTLVTAHWLQKMVVAAYSGENIGTVIPFSDAFKFLSDIIPETTNVKLKPNEIASLIENISEHLKPEVSNPNESCLYIKRETINDVGLFDEQNDLKKAKKDFYQKIIDKGWKNIIDDSTYVYQNIDSFDENWNNSIELSPIIERIKRIIRIRARDSSLSIPKKRLLIILHENVHGLTGGTGQTTKDILEKIDEKFECYILTPYGESLVLWKSEKNQIIMLNFWKIESKWSVTDFNNDEYKNIYIQVLIGLNIDIIHIQHLIRHTYDLPEVAKTLGIPIILSFHDFYYICPTINLLDHNNRYCEGKCNSEMIQCNYPVQIYGDMPIISDFIDIWKEKASELMDYITTVTAPTKSTMDLYISIYPQLKNKNYEVIEHGRDFDQTPLKVDLPPKDKPIKIIVPGIIKHHKGHDFIKALKKIDHENRIEFHFMGIVDDDLKEVGIYHGPYKNEDFCEIVSKIKPSFIGIFSICPETYCHVLTEAWSCGIPVLATKMGALEERIGKNGGGWFLDHENPLKSYNKILQIVDSPEEYFKVVEDVSNIKIKSKKEMANEYESIYLQNLVYVQKNSF